MRVISRFLVLLILALTLVACGGSSSGKARDTTAPVITLSGANPQVIEAGTAYVELGATATDNRDGDLSNAIVIDAGQVDTAVPGSYVVTYSATDVAGNTGTTTRTVVVEDTTPPKITLLGDNPQVIISGNPYSELGATASDSLDGDLGAAIVIDTTAVDTMVVGDYTVTYDVSDAAGNPAATVSRTVSVRNPPGPDVSVAGDIKTLKFTWTESDGAEFYRLLENPDGHSGFSQVGDDIPAGTLVAEQAIAVHLFDWMNAQYVVEACNSIGCNSSGAVTVFDVMLDAIGYFKPSNTSAGDEFGHSVALSADGNTLVVGAPGESSSATGINGDQGDDLAAGPSGAVYVFRSNGEGWSQQAYVKASNTDRADNFGNSVALSADGNTLVVGAPYEDSNAAGINGDQSDNSAGNAGAVYAFRFDGADWYQEAYIKASNPEFGDGFGIGVALSGDSNTMAVAARLEASSATGINGDQTDNSAEFAGAVYLFRFDSANWFQQAYIKASNTERWDYFGSGLWYNESLALSEDGDTLAVGARGEDSNATGIDGDQSDNSGHQSGAVYLYRFDGGNWYQQAYVKASNAGQEDHFGNSVALSADGNALAVGAPYEDSGAVGIDGDQADSSAVAAGAVYLFRYDGADWYQQAFIKASNTEGNDRFARDVALSPGGDLLAVGAYLEDGSATGINGDQSDNSAENGGAVYLFRFSGGEWSQQAYVKAPTIDSMDHFGASLALSAYGESLEVGAHDEGIGASGNDGEQADNSAESAGAVYVY